MRILVTGAAGFIGSQVVRIAIEEGHSVVALVRRGSKTHRLDNVRGQFQAIQAELRDIATIEPRLRAQPPDVCLHLAWYAEPGRFFWAEENLACLNESVGLLRLLHGIGCRRIVLAGTSAEYGPTTTPVCESSPIQPTTLYAASKHSLYLLADKLVRENGFNVAVGRIFSLYGPDEDPRRLVPFIITKLLAGETCELTRGDQVRDYSHVTDVAGAMFAIAKSKVTGPVNIGSSKAVSVASVAERLGRLLDRTDLLRLGARPASSDDPPFLVANTDRLRKEVGWKSHYELDAGLADTVEWWRRRRS